MIHPRWFLAALAVAAVSSTHAQAAREALETRTLAASCANCHGTDGRTAPGAPMRTLAGMPREELLAQLQSFRSGARPSTIMGQIAKGYSEAQLDRIAAWFAVQR